MNISLTYIIVKKTFVRGIKPASVAQLDAPSRGLQNSFVEIDYKIFSTVILSIPPTQEGQLSVSGEKNVHNTG